MSVQFSAGAQSAPAHLANSALHHPFEVTHFWSFSATAKQQRTYTLHTLAEAIRLETKREKGALPWLKLARFGEHKTERGSFRHDPNVLAITGIEADYDGGKVTVEEAVETLEKAGILALVYTSPSHTDDAPRWRVLCPLSAELPPDQRHHLMGRLNGLFRGILAPESWTLSQSYYFGSVRSNPSHTVVLVDGAPIDEADELDALWLGKAQTEHGDSKAAAAPQGSEPRAMDELVAQLVSGAELHGPTTALAMRYVKAGMADGQAVETLRGFYHAIPATARNTTQEPDRWESRFAEIPRAVASARAKLEQGGAEAVPAPAATSLRPPSLAILNRSTVTPPAFPLEALGPFWARWVAQAAEGANAPADYTALPLLVAASALIGNSRWAQAWQGWAEPPILWGGSVGNPSSGKSPGAAPVMRDTLGRVEMHMARDYPAELERWETVASIAKAALKQWERDVAKAIKAGDQPMPEKPDAATIPPMPVRPRASVSDATQEALAARLARQPKGVLHVRDELSGWLLNMGRYANGGSDRPFWLEAWNGGRHQVDRQKHPEPIILNHLAVATFGTIQPERLGEVFEGADDGLAGRFLWAWPDAGEIFDRPGQSANIRAAADALITLADLTMGQDEHGNAHPLMMRLDDAAVPLIIAFGREMQVAERRSHGLLKTAIGKARGHALRLALVLELLWWCGRGSNQPVTVSAEAMGTAAELMRGYFLPMARRVLGDAAVPREEVDARTLAEWIAATRPAVVNVSTIRDEARLPGLRQSDPVKAACRYLAEAGWLIPAHSTTARGGRPRGDYTVSPLLAAALDGNDRRATSENPENPENRFPAGARPAGAEGSRGFSGLSTFLEHPLTSNFVTAPGAAAEGSDP